MLIFPAIDLFEQKAVRLFQGDYEQMTVYNDNPLEVVEDFINLGATHLHLVDLEGAKLGSTPNLSIIQEIVTGYDLFTQVGGGIRSMELVDRYMEIGVNRVILGTSAVKDRDFLKEAVGKYPDNIAVGVDIKDGYVATNGWLESSGLHAMDFCKSLQKIGVQTIICTDISKDGAMDGSNHHLYKILSSELPLQIIASGGVSSIEDIRALRSMNLYGAIIGKAYYTGAVSLQEAIKEAT